MSSRLRLRLFAHSWRSDWNHGNAHFLRGLADELAKAGHEVRCYEADNAWSFVNLLREPMAQRALQSFRAAFPLLDVRSYDPKQFRSFAEEELKDADIAVVHEWSSPDVVNTILSLKEKYDFRLLFHDTHHRAYTSPEQISQFRIPEFDGVLAFGEAIRRIYLQAFHAARCWTFHEAADVARFGARFDRQSDEVNWIGNWGDDERARELKEFLLEPLANLEAGRASVYGVRYPDAARRELQGAGIEYRGYLPNLAAPSVYSRCALTLHIPRRFYANGLSGIPTIRMFEAMSCGIPLVCSPWTDVEGLFRPGQDYVCVNDGREMQAEIAHLLHDDEAREELSSNAMETIRGRHTCYHRARQFEEICQELSR